MSSLEIGLVALGYGFGLITGLLLGMLLVPKLAIKKILSENEELKAKMENATQEHKEQILEYEVEIAELKCHAGLDDFLI